LTVGTYEKWPKDQDGEFIVIWEYKTILKDYALGQGKLYNNWDFSEWILTHPDFLYGFSGGIPYMLPDSRQDYYKYSSYEEIEQSVLSQLTTIT
jgi:hypothetical protein